MNSVPDILQNACSNVSHATLFYTVSVIGVLLIRVDCCTVFGAAEQDILSEHAVVYITLNFKIDALASDLVLTKMTWSI